MTETICENFDLFLSFLKWQNNPKYGNLARDFHIYLTASGEGVNPSGQPDRFFPSFFDAFGQVKSNFIIPFYHI